MNRRAPVLLALAFCAPTLFAQDGVDLRAAKTGTPDEVRLDWTGGYAPFTVYRSSDPSLVVSPSNEIGTTAGSSWIDLPPAGTLWFYRVTSPCVVEPEICDARDNDCDTVADEGCAPCAVDGDCAPSEHCSTVGSCIEDFGNGSACSRGGQCVSDTCADDRCCDTACTGTCQACDIAGTTGTCENLPDGQDPDSECGAVSCSGYYWGWQGDTCYRRADVSASTAACGGDGACQSAAELCPGSGQGSASTTCDSVCQDPTFGTCSATTAGSCTNVSAGTQTCGVGQCERTMDRCLNGQQQPCTPGTPSSETCNDLDDDCDSSTDEGLPADGYESNDTCATFRTLPSVGSNQTQTLTDMTLYPSADGDVYRFTANETDSSCSCCDFFCTDEDFRLEVTLTVPVGAGAYWLCTAQQPTCPGGWTNCIQVVAGSSGTQTWTLDGSCGTGSDVYPMFVYVSAASSPGFECRPYTLRYRFVPGCF